jgi:hypothetical protein
MLLRWQWELGVCFKETVGKKFDSEARVSGFKGGDKIVTVTRRTENFLAQSYHRYSSTTFREYPSDE